MIPRSTLEAIERQFGLATYPEAVFGALAGSALQKLEALRYQSRSLTKTCHPDLAASGDKALATKVFQQLGSWEEVARRKIEIGTYGDNQPYRAPTPPYNLVTLLVRGQELTLTGLIAEGTFASVHAAHYNEAATHATFVKCARDASDNDLLEREYSVLKSFQEPDSDPQIERFLDKQRAYAPCPVTSFFILDENNAKHRANVLTIPNDSCYTAERLRQEKFRDGIEPRHVWWIFRRLLLTLWMGHLKGTVHGAVTPDHLLIFPAAHGLILLDWTCAAKIGEEHIPALNPAYEAFYPPETRHKELALPSADLFMAASTAIYMLGGDPATGQIPNSVSPVLSQCLLKCLDPLARRRPQDAQRFHEEFGALLGQRVYSPMVIP